MEKLKRVVIKEELVWLTGDFIKAAILQQFLYWTDRMKDVDTYILQENARAEQHGYDTTQDLTEGWVYKTAEELAEETMLKLSVPTMRAHIKTLTDKGYLNQRKNPKYRWDKTTQYRVDLIKVSNDLAENGYFLEGYKNLCLQMTKTPPSPQNTEVKKFNIDEKKVDASELKNLTSELRNLNSELGNLTAIPEITTETTTDMFLKEKETKEKNKVASKDAPSLSQKTKKRFIKPTLEEVKEYCQEKNYDISPEQFINYYESCGWEIKKGQKMKDWKAAVNGWVIRQKKWDKEKQQKQQAKQPRANQFANFEQRNWDFAQIERLMQEEDDEPNDGIITNYRPEPNNTGTTTKPKPQQSNSFADMMRKDSAKTKITGGTWL